ncbi:MAG: transketolase [Rhodospirillales bacterium]|jgi:transketolase|nr:transketolase [Rhodospirillales bacterium]
MNLISDLEKKAAEVRLTALETALKAGKGHVPPAFSWTEIAVALYYGGVLRFRPDQPDWPDRDRFILSKGHACLTLYAVLADCGFFDASELEKFAGDGSLLPGHPDFLIPGVDVMSGSLGHGLGVAAGLAMAAKLDGKDWRTFVVLGDGECHEGSVWEAAMFAGHNNLGQLVAIVDCNGLAATNFTDNIVTLKPFQERWSAFGWECVSIDGHSFDEILDVLSPADLKSRSRPLAVISNSVKGKGVSFMEDSPNWHHQLPKGERIDDALSQLRQQLAR